MARRPDGSYEHGDWDAENPKFHFYQAEQQRLQEQIEQVKAARVNYVNPPLVTSSPPTLESNGSNIDAAVIIEFCRKLLFFLLKITWYLAKFIFRISVAYFRRLSRKPALVLIDAAIIGAICLIAVRVYDVGRRPRPAWVDQRYHTPGGKLLAFAGALFYEPLTYTPPKKVPQIAP